MFLQFLNISIMKTLVWIVFFLSAFASSTAQENEFIGTWDPYSFKLIELKGHDDEITKKKIIEEVALLGPQVNTMYQFSENGVCKIHFSSFYGEKWKVKGDSLNISYIIDQKLYEKDFTFKLGKDSLLLSYTDPDTIVYVQILLLRKR